MTKTGRSAASADVDQTIWDLAEGFGHFLRLGATGLRGTDAKPLLAVLSRMEKRMREIGRGELASLLAEAHRRIKQESCS